MSSSKQRQLKSGRPKLSEVDRLRAKIWYCAVKRCGNWTDYKLDMEFGQAEGPIYTNGAGRNRVFGVIGSKGTLPSRGDHHMRKFDLVERVESHLDFKGTSEVIDSPFWDLLKLPPRNLETTSAFVLRCLEKLNLMRLSEKNALDWMWYASDQLFSSNRPSLKSTGAGPFEISLNDATKELQCDLNLIALFGGLYRESCLSFNPANAEILGTFFRLSLEQFCAQPWLGAHGSYLEDLARNRILYGKSEYIPPDARLESPLGLVPSEMQPQGLIVARGNPKLKTFLEKRNDISIALKSWIISKMSEEDIENTD